MVTLYKDGKTCQADNEQVKLMVANGWKQEKPKATKQEDDQDNSQKGDGNEEPPKNPRDKATK